MHTKNNVPAECMSEIPVEDCIYAHEPDYHEIWVITWELVLNKREAI